MCLNPPADKFDIHVYTFHNLLPNSVLSKMEKSTKSQECSQRRLKTVSMSDRTLTNSDNESERRASMPISTIRPLSDGIEELEGSNEASLPKNLIRSQSYEVETTGCSQRRMKSVSMPGRPMQNMATGIEKRASMPTTIVRSPSNRGNPDEDTIDEESIEELGQAIKGRPLSNELRNPEVMPRAKRGIQCSDERLEDRSSQFSIQSMPKTLYGSPHSAIGKRGYVLVIINNEFGGKYSKLPDGTDDLKEIKNLFSRINYIVVGLFNQSKNEILDTIKELASKEDSTRFICFLSSHGDETSLVCRMNAYGEETVKIRDVLRCANTPQLKDCPKIFFIDACRTGEDKIMRSEDLPEIPGRGYYLGLSCLHQMTSEWPIGTKSCGLYFDALIKVFKDNFGRPAKESHKIRDLEDLMDKAHHYLGQQTRNGQPIQTPEKKSTLSGRVFLHGHE